MFRLINKKVNAIVLIGESKDFFAQSISGCSVIIEESLEGAIATAKKHALEGTVLLSPGCASFDMFKDFIDGMINLMETVEDREKVTIDLCFNLSQKLEKIDKTKILIHGFLHLLGFDHKKNKDYSKMLKEENLLFKSVQSKIN